MIAAITNNPGRPSPKKRLHMNRRHLLLGALALPLLPRVARADSLHLEVFKTPTCGCCTAWVAHLKENGFNVTARDVDQGVLWSLKTRAGIPRDLASCHTAFAGDYVIEGHVPATDIARLFEARPDAIGLSVPGMPIGSPGMEMGDQRDAYDTMLILRDGTSEVFSSHS